MIKETIKKDYQVNDMTGVIKSPGKFEGEMLFVPYLWDKVMDGMAGNEIYLDETVYTCLEISQEDKSEFPEDLSNVFGAILWENSQGFVYCKTFDEKGYKFQIEDLENEAQKETENIEDIDNGIIDRL